MPSSKESTTLEKIITNKYLPPTEKATEKAHASVLCMRNIAQQILQTNKDVATVEFDADQEPTVVMDVVNFFESDLSLALSQAEEQAKDEGRELTEGDIVRLMPDGIGHMLAEATRSRVYDAVTSSTTDSM